MMRKNKIPTYLRKRKIELLRQKIIRRKYGYMFYRKTLSEILPSQARKHYLKQLIKNAFAIWSRYWYETRIGWKHLLRAEIHYNLKIQASCFRKWHAIHCARKKYLLKKEVACFHYEKISHRFETGLYFQKWTSFIGYQKAKRERLRWAWNHYKSRNFPLILRSYLHRWLALVKVVRKEEKRLNEFKKIFEVKLLGKCFRALTEYRTQGIKKLQAQHLYNQRLSFYAMKNWRTWLECKRHTKVKEILAHASHCFTLKKRYFKNMLINVTREKVLKILHQALNLRVTRTFFHIWVNWVHEQQNRKVKYELAVNYLYNNAKRTALRTLSKYVKYKKLKTAAHEQRLFELKKQLNKSKLKRCLIKWRLHTKYKKTRAAKSIEAFKFNQKSILKKNTSKWRLFANHKKHRKNVYCEAIKHYNLLLLRTSFHAILEHLIKTKDLKKRVEEAKTFYRRNLLEEALRVITLAGIAKKEQIFKENLERIGKDLFLAQKYLQIWKRKTFFNKTRYPKEDVYCESENDLFLNTDWFQMCFLMPKVSLSLVKQ